MWLGHCVRFHGNEIPWWPLLYLVITIVEEVLAMVDEGLGELLEGLGNQVDSVQGGDLWPQQGGPPAYGKIFTIHTVFWGVLTHSVSREQTLNGTAISSVLREIATMGETHLWMCVMMNLSTWKLAAGNLPNTSLHRLSLTTLSGIPVKIQNQ